LLYRFGLYLEEDFDLPQSARALYERAMALEPDDGAVEQKIVDGLKRLNALNRETAPQNAPAPASLDAVIAPESIGVKSPSFHRPSAAALIKRTGRLSVDRGRIKASTTSTIIENWPEIQKSLDEKMSQLLTQAAVICETAPRPMRLPRSIAPSQWLEFLESHLTLFLATLEAQGINIRTSVNVEDAPRNDVSERTRLVTALMDEISECMASVTPAAKAPPAKESTKPTPARLEDIFEWIEAGSLDEAESHLREINGDNFPKEQTSEVWSHLGLAFQNNHDSKRALAAYQRAREHNPQNLQAWFNAGMIQHEEGMLRPALQSYLRAIDLDPEQSKIW